MTCLSAKHIRKSFGDNHVLQNISLDFPEGIYGLIGANGAGKSTLIRIITGLLQPDEGLVKWDGQIMNQKMISSILGFMPQNQNGYDIFTAREFLFYMAALKGIPRKKAMSRINRLAKMTGLSECLDQKIKTYSGGMKQRLFFIQALLNNPKLLILDEPTTGLDPYERIRMRNLISRLSKKRVILIATHVMQDIESIADQVIFLNHGTIAYSGSIPDLLSSIQDRVQELEVSEDTIKSISGTGKISRTTRTDTGYRIRVICDKKLDGARAVPPDLEDCYLYYLS